MPNRARSAPVVLVCRVKGSRGMTTTVLDSHYTLPGVTRLIDLAISDNASITLASRGTAPDARFDPREHDAITAVLEPDPTETSR